MPMATMDTYWHHQWHNDLALLTPPVASWFSPIDPTICIMIQPYWHLQWHNDSALLTPPVASWFSPIDTTADTFLHPTVTPQQAQPLCRSLACIIDTCWAVSRRILWYLRDPSAMKTFLKPLQSRSPWHLSLWPLVGVFLRSKEDTLTGRPLTEV